MSSSGIIKILMRWRVMIKSVWVVNARGERLPIRKQDDALQLSQKLPAIYLVGPMGAGKTTVGRMLAKQLSRPFFDCDQYIVAKTGADIPWIFAKEGEQGFRERETNALIELTKLPKIVMATGGGAITITKNRTLLKQGLVVFLDAPIKVQLARTQLDSNRPLLQQDDPKAILEELYKNRKPLYQEVADMTLSADKLYPHQMVDDILSLLQEWL